MADPTRVVVTGLGLITGLGSGIEPTWQAMRAGRCAARVLDRVPTPPGEAPYAAFPSLHPDSRARMHLFKAAMDAVNDARIRPADSKSIDRDRIGTSIGFSKGDVRRLAFFHTELHQGRFPNRKDTGYLLGAWPNCQASIFAQVWDLRGPCLSPIAACATGVIAVLQAADLIRLGVCDMMLVGAGDSPLEPMILAAFRKMRAFARVDGDPSTAFRPWDRRRSGFLPGEGGAILVLEREDHAMARGILPYAEVCGGAFGSDAYHMTDLNPDPAGLSHLIGLALKNSKAAPSDIDYVNVHGTATRQNDPLECRAIRAALGSHADSVSCSANKAQIGHMMGASGAAELAITCLAIRDGFVPPTLNLDDPDPACDLDGTPHVGKERNIRAALKLSIGFGGHLAAAVLRRPVGPCRAPVPLSPVQP